MIFQLVSMDLNEWFPECTHLLSTKNAYLK